MSRSRRQGRGNALPLPDISTTATALKVLPIAARHPAQLYVAGSLALLGLGGLAVSYAAIAALVRNRGSVDRDLAGQIPAIIGYVPRAALRRELAQRSGGRLRLN